MFAMGTMWPLCLVACLVAQSAWSCSLEPAGAGAGSAVPKSHGDNYYRLIVNGEVERYAPGQRYVGEQRTSSITLVIISLLSTVCLWFAPDLEKWR